MAWWDEIVQWVEDRKRLRVDKNLGGWLPSGQEPQGSIQDAIWGASQWANRAIAKTLFLRLLVCRKRGQAWDNCLKVNIW